MLTHMTILFFVDLYHSPALRTRTVIWYNYIYRASAVFLRHPTTRTNKLVGHIK